MRVHILLDAAGQGARHGGLSVIEGNPDLQVPEHTHDGSAEVLLIEDGIGQMRCDAHQLNIWPHTVVYVPPGLVHDFRGEGSRPLRAIQIYAPSGPEQRFRGVIAP